MSSRTMERPLKESLHQLTELPWPAEGTWKPCPGQPKESSRRDHTGAERTPLGKPALRLLSSCVWSSRLQQDRRIPKKDAPGIARDAETRFFAERDLNYAVRSRLESSVRQFARD